MKFIIDVPNDMVSKDIIDPKEIIRLMRSHLAHLGTITVEPLAEGSHEDVMHMLTKIEKRLNDPEHYKTLLCNCETAEEGDQLCQKKEQ